MTTTIADVNTALWFAQYVSENSPSDGGDDGFSLAEQHATALLAFRLAGQLYGTASELAGAGMVSADHLLELSGLLERAREYVTTAQDRRAMAVARDARTGCYCPSDCGCHPHTSRANVCGCSAH